MLALREIIKLAFICDGIAGHYVVGRFAGSQNQQKVASAAFVIDNGVENDCSIRTGD